MLYDAIILLSALSTILSVVLYWRSELVHDHQLLYLILLTVFAVPVIVLLLGRRRWRRAGRQKGSENLHYLPADIDIRYAVPFDTSPYLSIALRWKRWTDGTVQDFRDPREDALPQCRVVDQQRDGFRLRIEREGVMIRERDRLHVRWRAVGTLPRVGRRA